MCNVEVMKAAFWTLILALAIPAKVLACTVLVGDRVPTNVELLEQAELVVLASVRSGPEQCRHFGNREVCHTSVILDPLRVFKGEPHHTLVVEGSIKDRRGEPYLPLPTKLDEPNPSSLWGSCLRQAYSEQSLVIAMFSASDGQFRQLGFPFARTIEDVEGPDALWVRATKLYIRLLMENAPRGRRQAFLRERDRLRALTSDTDA